MDSKARPLRTAILTFLLGCQEALPGQTVAFDPALVVKLGRVPEALGVGDLNRDGIADIAVANTGADGIGGDDVTILMGRGDGTFQRTGPFPAGNRPEGIVVALANDDQILDVVTANFEGDSVSIILGNRAGGLKAPLKISIKGGPRFVAAGDLDRDGIMDFATSNYNSNQVSIIRGRGRGRWGVAATLAVDRGPEVVAIADFNGDGNPDLVTANALGDTITPIAGDGAGHYTVGTHHPVGHTPRFVAASDLDGDGFADIIVANDGDDSVTVERSNGDFTFTTVGTIAPTLNSVPLKRPDYLALADLTGDGFDDLLVTWSASDILTVHPRRGPSTAFEPFWPLETGDVPVGIAAADLNGDGARDIVATNSIDGTASVYLTYEAVPGIIIDNDMPGTTRIGPWIASGEPYPFGEGSLFSKDGTRYIWDAPLPAPGLYEVLLWWTVNANRSPAVVVDVLHEQGVSGLLVDQRRGFGAWQSLGVFPFNGTATVTMTSPQDGDSVSADAVRLRPVSDPVIGPPPATVLVEGDDALGETELDDGRVLALRGRISVGDATGPEEWLAAVVTPIGDGEESASIEDCRLYVDSNGNGVYDSADRQLGPGRSFPSDIRAAVFSEFAESLPPRSTTDFFVVCELRRRVASGPVRREPGNGAPAAAAVLACGVALMARARRRIALAVVLVGLLVPAALLVTSGCDGGGGGGGGGVPAEVELRLELSSLVVLDGASRVPAPLQGLPARGWKF